jgi:hypothetical protein
VKLKLIGIMIIGMLLVANITSAHHSAAMFDRSRVVTLEGSIKEYQFLNPHVWIEILVPGEDGTSQQWSIEGEGRDAMVRIGLGRKVIQAGDHVTIRTHPLRDGRPAGSFIDIILPDGKVINVHQPQAKLDPKQTEG